MKTRIVLLWAATLVTAQAWTVYDPAVHTSIVVQTAKEVAKYAEMIGNQVEQIHTLTDQLNEFRHYEELFGDPKEVILQTAQPLMDELHTEELGKSWETVVVEADGAKALVYDAGGLYHGIGATFVTPMGERIARFTNAFRPFAAINAASANFQVVITNVTARRVAIREEIAQTIEQLRAAENAAEVAKLSGVLSGLGASLAGTEQEGAQAAATVMVQDIENHNDERKQLKAMAEEQAAAFREAMVNFAKTFHVVSEPTSFPAP